MTKLEMLAAPQLSPGPRLARSAVEGAAMGFGVETSATISQAAGMVSVQAECTLDQALQLLKDRAIVSGETVDDVAWAVVTREISFGMAF